MLCCDNYANTFFITQLGPLSVALQRNIVVTTFFITQLGAFVVGADCAGSGGSDLLAAAGTDERGC